jgi:hypothetical protein
MTKTWRGHRVFDLADIENPCDYYGPTTEFTHHPSVFFLKPNAHDSGVRGGIQHCSMPPHIFSENDDGSLTISPSISDTIRGGASDGWHGFLENGIWRQV